MGPIVAAQPVLSQRRALLAVDLSQAVPNPSGRPGVRSLSDPQRATSGFYGEQEKLGQVLHDRVVPSQEHGLPCVRVVWCGVV